MRAWIKRVWWIIRGRPITFSKQTTFKVPEGVTHIITFSGKPDEKPVMWNLAAMEAAGAMGDDDAAGS